MRDRITQIWIAQTKTNKPHSNLLHLRVTHNKTVLKEQGEWSN